MFVQLSRCRLHVTLSNAKYSKCPKFETVYLYLEITIKMPEAVKSRNTTQMQITNSCHSHFEKHCQSVWIIKSSSLEQFGMLNKMPNWSTSTSTVWSTGSGTAIEEPVSMIFRLVYNLT